MAIRQKDATVRERFRLPPFPGLPAEFLRRLNDILERVSRSIAEAEGSGDRTIQLRNDLDLQENRLTNVGDSTTDTDGVSRRELKENALYVSRGKHRARFPISARRGIRIPPASRGDEAVPRAQITDEIGSAINAAYFKATVSGASPITVTHNLDETHPIVQVYNSGGSQILLQVETLDANNIRITFNGVAASWVVGVHR